MKRIITKKLILIFMLVFLMSMISGCALFNIDAGIDANNTAFLSYRLELDISSFNPHQQFNFKEALFAIATYYQSESGFVVSLDTDVNPIIMTARKSISNNSFEEAFQSLKSLLTNENISVFKEVDIAYVSYPKQLGYVFSGIINVPRIIRSNDIYDLPLSMRQSFDEAIINSSGTLTVTVPADELIQYSGDTIINDGLAKITVPLDFSGDTAFSLYAVQNRFNTGSGGAIESFIGNIFIALFGDSGNSFITEQLRFRSYSVMITFFAIILIVVTIVTSIVILIVKRK